MGVFSAAYRSRSGHTSRPSFSAFIASNLFKRETSDVRKLSVAGDNEVSSA